MNGSITPTFIEEATILIKGLKIIKICFGTKPVKVADFKVRPLKPD